MSKAFVLGIEGLDYNLVQEWKDDLPNISKIQEKYIFGRIKNEVNPTRAMDWTSIYTGQNPGESGIWDNVFRDTYDYKLKNNFSLEAIGTDGLSALLPKTGKILALINYPFTDKALKITSGYCVSGPVDEGSMEDSIYPTELVKDIGFKSLIDKYIEAKKNNSSLKETLPETLLLAWETFQDKEDFHLAEAL